MSAVFLQIRQMISHKEEVLPPLQPSHVVRCRKYLYWYNLWSISLKFLVCAVFEFLCVVLFHCGLFVFVIFFIFVWHTAQDVLIYLFGETAVHLTVEGLGSVTVQELGRIVRETIHIPESAQDVFAFWLTSPLLGKNLSFPHSCSDSSFGSILQTLLTVWHSPPAYSSELQLKARHQPYKLCRQWQDLLYRFTEASEEDISQGECSCAWRCVYCTCVTALSSACHSILT